MMTKLQFDKVSWTSVKFGDVVSEVRNTVKSGEKENIERYIGLEHIDSENIHITKWGYVKNGTTFTRKFDEGQILFGRRRAYLKKAGLATFTGLCSGDIIVMEAKEKLLPELLPFLINNNHFFDFAVDTSAGSLSPRTKFKHLAEYQFLLPPKDQQAKIAKLLWAMDDVVEKEKVLLENLNISYLSEIEKVLLNKDGEIRKVSDLGEIIRGVGYKPGDLSDEYSDENCIILRANNIKDSDINYDDIKILSLSKVKKIQLLQQNDFAICMSNGSKELVGKTAKYNNESKNVSIGSFCSAFRANGSMETSIVQHFFASETYRQTIKRVLTGSNINNLKPIDIESIKFRINESESILSNSLIKLDKMKRTTFRIKKSIEDSKQLQKSLINEIFSV